ncbi:CIC11C00000002446 [Sungouiella intermedia]|uniref:CIC11C00000002446 n=1 Tax=Sungouiella intermedia TaxID=45354 RepID=A0A1L0BU96_9ASCO|nr:CIC11C00000002446 [[Candida] intermedia]
MKLSSFLLGLFGLLTVTSALYLNPTKPSEDDFYKVPPNVEDYAEGDIINWRPAPLVIRSIYYPVNIKNAWQFLVRTLNSDGNATAFVTTVFEPYDADPSKLLSYQFAEDSASPNCAPSYSVLFGASMDTLFAQVEMILLGAALSRGWYVVAPDYEGPNAVFCAGRQAGRATLDSIRAALQSQNTTGIDTDAKVALWGYSGGTIASGWAAQLQPKYAPELEENLIGVAIGGWSTNITETVLATDGTLYSGLIPNGINGLVQEFTEWKPALDDALEDDRKEWFYEAADKCLMGSIIKFAFHNYFSGSHPYFKQGWDFFKRDDVNQIILYNTLGLNETDGIPNVPMFLFHAVHDEICPFSGGERVYNNYCKWGIESFEFSAATSSGHLLEAAEGSGAALKWLEDRFAGKPTVKGCQRTNRTSNLDYPGADLSYYQILKTVITSIPGGEIGQSFPRNATTSNRYDSTYEWLSKFITSFGTIPL